MNLQFSFLGYAIIAGLYVITALLALALWRSLRRYRWLKAPLAVLLTVLVSTVLVLPWAEEIRLAQRFEALCETAGVHVTRQVEVDGYYDDIMRSGYLLINEKGYSVMEHRSLTKGKIEHVRKDGNEWTITQLEQPTARYHHRYSNRRPWVSVEWKLVKSEQQILDTETGIIIARNTRFKRADNTVETQWSRFLGRGADTCYGPPGNPAKQKRIGQLSSYVFLPKIY